MVKVGCNKIISSDNNEMKRKKNLGLEMHHISSPLLLLPGWTCCGSGQCVEASDGDGCFEGSGGGGDRGGDAGGLVDGGEGGDAGGDDASVVGVMVMVVGDVVTWQYCR